MGKNLPAFKMSEKSKTPQINLQKLIAMLRTESGLSICRVFGNGVHTVIIHPDAEQEINTYFKYGQGCRAVNQDEQQAVLYGHRFLDEKEHYVFLVTRAAYIYPAERRRSFVATSGDNKDDFMEFRLRLEQAIVNENEARHNKDEHGYVISIGVKYYGPSERIGQIHTHPGQGSFFSSIDHASNESTVPIPYAYLVCDPIRKDFCAMVGVNGEHAKIVFLKSTNEEATKSACCEDSSKLGGKTTNISRVAAVCRGFLNNPGVRGRFRMFYDSKGKAHVKFHARFVCSNDAAEEFEQTRTDDAWR